MSSKLREALAEMVEYAQSAACHSQDAHIDHYLSQIIAWGKKALQEPLRNCDVGTAEEQSNRFDGHCRICDGSCCDHRLTIEETQSFCALEWAQMPYKEGGKE